MNLDLKRFADLKGKEKYTQYLRVVKTISQLENYKKELAKELLPLISEKSEQRVITTMGTIQYIAATTREVLDKDKLVEKFGLTAVNECTKTANVSAALRTSLKVD